MKKSASGQTNTEYYVPGTFYFGIVSWCSVVESHTTTKNHRRADACHGDWEVETNAAVRGVWDGTAREWFGDYVLA